MSEDPLDGFEPVPERKFPFSYVVYGLLGLIVLVLLVLVGLWWFKGPKMVASVAPTAVPTATPEAPTQVDDPQPTVAEVPTQVDPQPTPVAPAPTEDPAAIEAARMAAGPQTIVQVGSGEDILTNWTDASKGVQVVSDPSEGVKKLMLNEAVYSEAPRLIYIHSDPGRIVIKGSDGKVLFDKTFSKSFILVSVAPKGTTIEISGVGFNATQGHYNTWAASYGIPNSLTADEAGAYLLWKMQGKTVEGFSKDASVYWSLPENFNGEDPTVFASLVTGDGTEYVVSP